LSISSHPLCGLLSLSLISLRVYHNPYLTYCCGFWT
jgi:hypothetical protein